MSPPPPPPLAPGAAVGRWRHRDVVGEPSYSERGGLWEEGGGLEGEFLFVLIWGWEKWGESESSPQAVQRGRGRVGSPAGTEGGVMSSSLARSHVSLSLAHTQTLISAHFCFDRTLATKTEELIPVGQFVLIVHWCRSLSNLSLSFLHTSTIWKKKRRRWAGGLTNGEVYFMKRIYLMQIR